MTLLESLSSTKTSLVLVALALTSGGSWVHASWSQLSLWSSKEGWEALNQQFEIVLDVLVVGESRPVGTLVVRSTEGLEVVSILGSFVVHLSDFLDLVMVDGESSSFK